jgi:3-hydroxybutyryl-CoA dehydratase
MRSKATASLACRGERKRGTIAADQDLAGGAVRITRDRRTSAETFSLHELCIGQRAAFDVVVDAPDVDAFVALSGDANPLHVDDGFARERGYEGRVVHGAYLIALVSRLVGMQLPGRNALLLTVNVSFVAPVFIGTALTVSGEIEQVSAMVASAIVKISVTNATTGATVARGRATVGFTDQQSESADCG